MYAQSTSQMNPWYLLNYPDMTRVTLIQGSTPGHWVSSSRHLFTRKFVF